MKNFILTILCLYMFSLCVNAGCYTGAACSIDSLEQQEYTNALERYFSRSIDVPNFVATSQPIMFYNDLFLFNTIV